MASLVFHFHKKTMENEIQFIFRFSFSWRNWKLKYLNNIKINFLIIVTSMVYPLFKSKFVSSPRKFSAVQGSRGHQESAV